MATNFKIRAVLDPAGVVGGARAAQASLVGLQRQANVLGATFARVFGVVGLAIGIKTSIDLIADFQQSIATATAIATRDLKMIEGNMASLSEEARRLGRTTRFTAKEAADGMLFLARAGFEVNEVLAITADTLKLAQAGNLDVGRAADIVTNVMAGFSAAVSQSSRFVDVLALSANSSNTNIQQLGDALKFAGPVASATGVQVEEAAAAVGALSNAGLQGTLAGTGLRRVISELEAPSTKAQKFLKRLGLTMKDVSVTENGLTGAIKRLTEAGFDVGDSFEFFNDRGGVAFQVLKSAVEQGFLQDLTSRLLKAGGTAEKLAKVMDETLKGALFALGAAFEAIILAAGELKTAGGLEDWIRGTTQLMRNLAMNIELVTKLVQILASVIIVLLVRKALLFLNGALVRLFAVIAANPVGALGIAFVALTAAVIAFSDQLSISSNGMVKLQDFGTSLVNQLEIAFSNLALTVSHGFTEMSDSADTGTSQIALFFIALLQTVAQVFDGIFGIVTIVPLAFRSAFDNAALSLTEFFKITVNSWLDYVTSFVNESIKLLNKLPKVDIPELGEVFRFEVDEGKVDTFFDELAFAMEAGAEALPEFLGGKGGPLEQAILKAFDEAPSIAAARKELEKLKEEIKKFKPPDIVKGDPNRTRFNVMLDSLREESKLLRLTSVERDRVNKLKEQETELQFELNEVQKQQLDHYNNLIMSLGRQNQLLSTLTTGQLADLAQQEADLGQLWRDNRISLGEYSLALEDLRYQSLQFAQDIDSGEMRALIRVKQEIRDIASLTENTLVNAFQSVEDAIVSFVSTGEVNIHQLAQTIFAETTRILLRLMLVRALGGLMPGAAAPIPLGFSPLGRFQHGGSFTVGGSGGSDSQLVAFRASPGERVDVSRPGQGPGDQPPPEVTIKNVTVFDAGMMVDAMSSGAGERAVLNVIQRNPSEVKKVLR
jgi:TP901 family phage tail tape measure protein